MATQVKKKEESRLTEQAGVWAVVGAALVLLLFIGFVAHRAFAPSGPSYAHALGLDKHPFPSWVSADAQQAKGDISKLSPAEQQRLNALYPNSAGTVIKAAFAVQ